MLDRAYFRDHGVQRPRHQLVHDVRFAALHEIRIVSIPGEELREFAVGHPAENGGVRDFVAVQVQDGQNGAVARGVQKLVRMPARRKRSRFRFSIAHDATDQQVRVIKRGAVGMGDGIAQLSALVDRAGRLRRHVARNPAGKGELLEQALHALFGLLNIGIKLAVRALEIRVRDKSRAAMAGPGDINGVQIKFLDRPVHVHVDEIQAGRRAPVAQQARLDVLDLQRLAQHADSQAGRFARRKDNSPRASRHSSWLALRLRADVPKRQL